MPRQKENQRAGARSLLIPYRNPSTLFDPTWIHRQAGTHDGDACESMTAGDMKHGRSVKR